MITLSDNINTQAPKPADAKGYTGPLLDYKTKEEIPSNSLYEGMRINAFEAGVWKEYRYLGNNVWDDITGGSTSISGFEYETKKLTDQEDQNSFEFDIKFLDMEKTKVHVNGIRIINNTTIYYSITQDVSKNNEPSPDPIAKIEFTFDLEMGDTVQLSKHK